MNINEPIKGDTQAYIEESAIVEALRPNLWSPGEVASIVVPAGWVKTDIDREDLLPAPRRSTGTVKVLSAEGFVNAVAQRRSPGAITALYANEDQRSLVAVLNDDGPDAPGWRDYRVELQLTRTIEWKFWLAGQGLKTQEEFASVIEGGSTEIRVPAAAEMLTIASTFEAKIDATFQQGSNLVNGGRQLTYSENVTANAGPGGSLTIPDQITLAVRPFVGADLFDVKAIVRFKVRNGKLAIGYDLFRPEDIERIAFNEVASTVATGCGVGVVTGIAPLARS